MMKNIKVDNHQFISRLIYANNALFLQKWDAPSLYVFSLRSCDQSELIFLKFLCAYLNSDLLTFFCQQMEIIRYHKGKQPQIKISDLYTIPIPSSKTFQILLATLVHDFYINKNIRVKKLLTSINSLVYNYYDISSEERELIKKSIFMFQYS